MGDPYDSFECRIRIVDLIDKRVFYYHGQCGVKSGCWFLKNSRVDKKNEGGGNASLWPEEKIRTIKQQDLSAVETVRDRQR